MNTLSKISIYACILLFNATVFAQLPKITKPKINVEVPKVNVGNGNNSDSKPSIPGRDPSGLFLNTTDDVNAEYHRKAAVTNLTTLEAEYQKTSIDYEDLTKLIFENERTLGHITKLEPKVNRSKYDERYLPLKERADKENAAYAEMKKLAALFDSDFAAPVEFKKPDPITFRTDNYGAHTQCYCRNWRSEVATLAEFETAKKSYEDYAIQLVGFTDEDVQKRFTNMETCIQNGNKYALWVCNENYTTEIKNYTTENKVADPKKVISRCEDYLAALERIETDNSLRLDTASISALATAKTNIGKTKSEMELYISSGQYQQYLDKVHAAEIAKVFLPKSSTKNATLEQGAITYVKGTDYNDYLKNDLGESGVASTFKAITVTSQPWVKKNEYGLPLYQYHEMWVSYKGLDGKCYMCAVYASYTYKGGGTYATQPTWGADAPEEMACDNVLK